MSHFRLCFALLTLSTVAFGLVGCGDASSTGTVKGVAMLNGQPYANSALILLNKTTGDGASVDLASDGTFQVPTPLKTGDYTVYLAPKSAPVAGEPAPVTLDANVPEAYWNEATSTLQVTVNPGANDVKVEITK
jgi:hypothetical protein